MTGFVNEILGDDRLWDTGWPETALTGWPLPYEIANLAILNRSTTKTVVIRTLNTRPYTGPCGTFPLIQTGRITGYTGGTAVSPILMDTASATPALQVVYRPSSVTETASTRTMTQWVNTGMNLTRTQQWSRWQGESHTGFDQTEINRWHDADTQKITLREGEGVGLFFKTDSGPNIFVVTAFVTGAGGSFVYNNMAEPLYMSGACFFAMYNPAGSGDIFYVSRLQAREIGSDEMPWLQIFKICAIYGQPDTPTVVWADSDEAIPTDIQVAKNCTVMRHGLNNGAVISAPHLRRIMGGEAPYGPGVANGGSVARRGKWSYDMRFPEDAVALRLGPGDGIAAVLRNPSAYAYSELITNFAVETASTGGGTYPTEANVRTAISYGPTGVEYTGNITLPVEDDVRVAISYGSSGTEATGTIALPAVGDVRLGTSYGSNGTEATGTLAVGGGGGGRHIVISGGWN